LAGFCRKRHAETRHLSTFRHLCTDFDLHSHLVKADLEILANLAQRGVDAIAALDAALEGLLGRSE
jgi:hypothetical protein